MIYIEAVAETGRTLPPHLRQADGSIRDMIASIYPDTPRRNLFDHVPGVLLAAKPDMDSDQVIGIANVRSEAPTALRLPDTAWIDALVVAPGCRRGEHPSLKFVGTRLAERAISIARLQEVDRIALAAVDERSERFWTSQGFTPIAEQPGQQVGTTLMMHSIQQ